MRKLPFIVVMLIAGCLCTGVAWAHYAPLSAPAHHAKAAGVRLVVPVTMPVRDVQHPVAYGFLSERQLSRAVAGSAARSGAGAARSASASSAAAASTTVVVTAVVLPVRTIVIDTHGEVRAIWSNTHSANPRASLYVVRVGSASGHTRALTTAIWQQVRTLLAQPHPVYGKVVDTH